VEFILKMGMISTPKPVGATKLSQLDIDVDKDWEAKGISNLKEIALAMAHGDVNFRAAAVIEKLTPGISGQYLKTQGINHPPMWDDLPGGRFERLFFLDIPAPPSISLAVAEDHSGGGFTSDLSLSIPAPPTISLSELALFDQLYESGDDGDFSIYGVYWEAQTFTTNQAHNLEIVEVKCRLVGSAATVGNITIGIRATSGGLPTGADLTSVTFAASDLPTADAWLTKYLTAQALTAATKYAIVIRASNGDGSNYMIWRKDGTAPTYAGGARCLSANSGVDWTEDANTDFMFREGEVI